ncbi:MAG: hypothetical protein KAW13_01895 [Dehalococcoidia bacterium]|nr:hypothetical protein [Dehalococcoidia bacterium]
MKEANGGWSAESTAQLEKLSKAELIQLVRLYSKLFLAVDAFWYLAVKEIVDEDTATACDLWVWERYSPYEFKRLMSLMNIKGNDLEAFAAASSFSPWFSNLNYRFTREEDNKLTFTVLECPTLQALRREGAGRENTICQQVEPRLFQIIIQSFNPKGKVIPIELPPEASKDSICCRWQFSIEE